MSRDVGPVLAASAVFLAALSGIRCLAETVVLPAVARGVPGKNGSFWDSEVRISGPDLGPPGPVRRLWVALPEGGFVDDPASAPHWVFPPFMWPSGMLPPAGLVVLTGDQLLRGTDAPKAAVALDIGGSDNRVLLHNANTLSQPRLPQDTEGPPCCLPGNGQLIEALRVPLVRQGVIPWATSGRSPYRVSVGLINPTAQSRTIFIELCLLQAWPDPLTTDSPDGTYWLQRYVTSLPVELLPWGFRQIDSFISVILEQCPSCEGLDRVAPVAIKLVDDRTLLPFYGYASVIWSPLNDPEFIAGVPLAH